MNFLGIDYGAARTGFAVGEDETGIAFPREVIESDWEKLRGFVARVIVEEKIGGIVLGLPKTLEQKESDSTRAVMAFAEKLREAFPDVSVSFQDEVFSTKVIQPGTVAKDRVDAASAALILQSFLDGKKSTNNE